MAYIDAGSLLGLMAQMESLKQNARQNAVAQTGRGILAAGQGIGQFKQQQDRFGQRDKEQVAQITHDRWKIGERGRQDARHREETFRQQQELQRRAQQFSADQAALGRGFTAQQSGLDRALRGDIAGRGYDLRRELADVDADLRRELSATSVSNDDLLRRLRVQRAEAFQRNQPAMVDALGREITELGGTPFDFSGTPAPAANQDEIDRLDIAIVKAEEGGRVAEAQKLREIKARKLGVEPPAPPSPAAFRKTLLDRSEDVPDPAKMIVRQIATDPALRSILDPNAKSFGGAPRNKEMAGIGQILMLMRKSKDRMSLDDFKEFITDRWGHDEFVERMFPNASSRGKTGMVRVPYNTNANGDVIDTRTGKVLTPDEVAAVEQQFGGKMAQYFPPGREWEWQRAANPWEKAPNAPMAIYRSRAESVRKSRATSLESIMDVIDYAAKEIGMK